ncbi:MAG: GCN5-related N-acetyltransferase [Anaeromyxobacteraceae bacterium]|nr:GCN5-related N-acetyltransferase [Anaeromyxobacteraceae bacterium]
MARLRFRPLTADRLPDLERLFGPRGACGGCWCMFWKQTRPEYEKGKGAGNRDAMRRQVRAGVVPGILAYDADGPVGWCAVEPRSAFPRLARSRTLAPVDDSPAWSVPCFFVARRARGTGLTAALLAAAAAHARRAGAAVLEGYPVDPRGETADAWLYTGLASTFLRSGFTEVARRSPTRPVMRLALRPARRGPAARGRARGRSTARSSPTRRSPSRRDR